MITIKDVAKEAKVSVATVSRVINKKNSVNSQTKEKVKSAIEKLNYIPNEVARSLYRRTSKTIAVIVPSINNPFFPELVQSIEDEAHKNGYRTLLCNTNNNRERLLDYLESLQLNYVDGIIISSQQLLNSDIKRIKLNGIAIVTIDRYTSSDLCSSISIKNREGGQQAAQYLLEKGCKKLAHLRGPIEISTANERFKGFKEIIESKKSFAYTAIEIVDFNVEGGYKGMSKILSKHPDVDGVFASNDLISIGAIKSARENGYSIPDDLLMIGFDGIDLTNLFYPTISTLLQPVTQMGEMGVKEVISFIDNPNKKIKSFKLDVKLMKRESTKD